MTRVSGSFFLWLDLIRAFLLILEFLLNAGEDFLVLSGIVLSILQCLFPGTDRFFRFFQSVVAVAQVIPDGRVCAGRQF